MQGTNEIALETLKRHGKTFNFARLFLSKETGEDAAVLYQFCRLIDDIADETPDKEDAKTALNAVSKSIIDRNNDSLATSGFIHLCDKYDMPAVYGLQLIHGTTQDLYDVKLQTKADLIQYAYYVAGVVGLMMAPILGASKKGHPFAIDLGIGMQLTNIARDVLEDAKMNRRYLPGEWVGDLTPQQIAVANTTTRATVTSAIEKTLALAETYYISGFKGLHYLPAKSRRAIMLAGVLYREIGRKLLKNKCRYWQGRTVISTAQKCAITLQYLPRRSTLSNSENAPEHTDILHEDIKCLINQG